MESYASYNPQYQASSSSSSFQQHPSTQSVQQHLTPNPANSNDLKRRKLSPELYQVSRPSTPSLKPTDPSASISTPALLYHLALSAHQASHNHLQQAFVHPSISIQPQAGIPLGPLYSPFLNQPFIHDPKAAAKALGLQLLALDLLRAGLSYPNLSEKERVAFGLEYGIVGLKVYLACKEKVTAKGKGVERKPSVDIKKLMGDIQDVVGQSYFISQKQTSFMYMKHQLELLNARLAFVQGKLNLGKRMVQQALGSSKNQTSHRYALYLLYLEFLEPLGSPEVLSVADELMAEAYSKNHSQMVQLAALTKTRFVFVYRRWELATQALAALSSVLGLTTNSSQAQPIAVEGDRTWQASLNIHYLIFKSLWEGRVGNDSAAKTCLRQIYGLMDEAVNSSMFSDLRARGGVMMLNIPNDVPLQIQMTPPNILYMLTYLTTTVSRRDYTGSNSTCQNIIHPVALKRYESNLRAEDMWDSGFSTAHDISRSQSQQKEVMMIRGEMMIEHASALLFRSDFEAGHQLLLDAVDHLRAHDLFQLFAPHLCLLFAQHATLVGLDAVAAKYYHACMRLINAGSEFGLIAEIGLMGSRGQLTKLLEHPILRDQVNILAEKCKGSTSAMMNGAGHLLASLADENVVNSKSKLSAAYEISVKSNNNMLRLLIFAFTTSTHHYGGRDRMYKQLETGRDLARLLGGKDRQDGVGQVVLGLWFAYRLKEYYRQEGDQQNANRARESIKVHLDRLNAIKAQAASLESVLAKK